MAAGKYHMQYRFDFDPNREWKNDTQRQCMAKDFAAGVFSVLGDLAGGSTEYRLVKSDHPPSADTPESEIKVLATHRTGEVTTNCNERQPIRDEDARDIVHRLKWALEDGRRCECDLNVGYICETCGKLQLLIDAMNEIERLRAAIAKHKNAFPDEPLEGEKELWSAISPENK